MADALKARRSCGGQLDRLRFRLVYVPFTRSPHIPAAVNVGLGHEEKNSQRAYLVCIAPIPGIPASYEAGLGRANDRDRGVPHGTAPPTPPGIRVRTTAVRLSYAWAVT
jgi:hypothetical protein